MSFEFYLVATAVFAIIGLMCVIGFITVLIIRLFDSLAGKKLKQKITISFGGGSPGGEFEFTRPPPKPRKKKGAHQPSVDNTKTPPKGREVKA